MTNLGEANAMSLRLNRVSMPVTMDTEQPITGIWNQ